MQALCKGDEVTVSLIVIFNLAILYIFGFEVKHKEIENYSYYLRLTPPYEEGRTLDEDE